MNWPVVQTTLKGQKISASFSVCKKRIGSSSGKLQVRKDRLYVKNDGTFVRVFSQVQLNVSCSIKLFAGLLSFVDVNSKTTHIDALFGCSYSVVRHHFISNRSLDVDCTLSNFYQSFSVSFKSSLSQN